jgi:hypothetical protein
VQVERFLVVHGQIIINQFKNYPIKSVQRCAFVTSLKDRMEARLHSKLFFSKRKITVDVLLNRKLNPMRNRSPAFKPKPMTATATNLVKEVWLDYFKGYENGVHFLSRYSSSMRTHHIELHAKTCTPFDICSRGGRSCTSIQPMIDRGSELHCNGMTCPPYSLYWDNA